MLNTYICCSLLDTMCYLFICLSTIAVFTSKRYIIILLHAGPLSDLQAHVFMPRNHGSPVSVILPAMLKDLQERNVQPTNSRNFCVSIEVSAI